MCRNRNPSLSTIEKPLNRLFLNRYLPISKVKRNITPSVHNFQRDGTEVWTPLRQGRVHRLQARTPQPTREHRSPEGRRLRRQRRRQVVHRQEMRIRLQGKQRKPTRDRFMCCTALRHVSNKIAVISTIASGNL